MCVQRLRLGLTLRWKRVYFLTKWKFTATVIMTGTGSTPFFIAGLNLYLPIASMAFWSRPGSKLQYSCLLRHTLGFDLVNELTHLNVLGLEFREPGLMRPKAQAGLGDEEDFFAVYLVIAVG